MKPADRTAARALLALVALALAVLFVGLFREERALVEETPERVVFTSWLFLPSSLVSAVLALLALLIAAGALALAPRLPWLLLRPVRGDPGEWRYFDLEQLALRPAQSRGGAALRQAALLLVTVAIMAALAFASYGYGCADRAELDLGRQRYRLTTTYLGLLAVRDRTGPLADVLRAEFGEDVHDTDNGGTVTVHSVTIHLADGSSRWITGPKAECVQAADAFQRLLANRSPR